MNSASFKPGDYVRRIRRGWGLLQVGDVNRVTSVNGSAIELAGFDRVYEASYFELANPSTEVPAPAPITYRKDDQGKLDMTLLDDMPLAIKAVVEVMQWAITEKKPVPYGRGSWQSVPADRYRAAIMRHNRDACEQVRDIATAARFQRDKETNKLHLAHIACSALMALELVMREERNAGN